MHSPSEQQVFQDTDEQIGLSPGDIRTLTLTADGKIQRCHGTSQVELLVDCMRPLHLEAQVIKRKLLGFDLLLGFDTINRLRGVHLTESGEIHFLMKNLTKCAAIKIDEPNFSPVFDQQKEWR